MFNCRIAISFLVMVCMGAWGSIEARAASYTSPFSVVDSTKASFPKTSLGSTAAAQTIAIKTARSVTITSVAIASSVNNHQEFAAGAVSGCVTDGSTATASGTTCSISVTFAPYYSGLRTGTLTVTDSTGTVYSVGLSGIGDGPSTLLTPTAVSTLAGASGGTYYSGDGGAAASARLGLPEGIAVDSSNNVFTADYSTNNIRVIYQSGAALACLIQIENPTLFGLPTGSTSCSGATPQPTAGSIYTLGGDTTAYSTSSSSHATGKTDKVLAASVGATTLYSPSGVAVDSAGNVIIANYGSYNVRVIYSGGDTMACLIELEQPTSFGLATGATSCSGATSSPIPGYIYNLAGTGTVGSTGDGALASSALMANLYAVAVDADGDIFVVDDSVSSARTTRIRVIYNGGAKAAALIAATHSGVAPVRGYIYKLVGGKYDSIGDGGLSTAAGLIYSRGVAVDTDGDVVFTDYNTSATVSSLTVTAKVRVVYNGGAQMAQLIKLENPNVTEPTIGYVYSLAGTTNPGTASGNFAHASAANFITPYGVAINAAGDIFVADYGDRTIRRISSKDGNIYPYAGQTGSQGVVSGNSLTTALLWTPFGLAVGSSGTLFFTEYGVFRIRSVGISTSDINFSTAVPSGNTGDPTFVYLTNLGNEAATISSVTASKNFVALSPTSSSFYANDCTALPTLQPGDTCAVGAALQPTDGGSLTGTLTITDNSGGNTATNHTVDLTGFSAIQTTTTLASSNQSANAGDTITYTATVAAAAGQDTSSAPALIGTVNFLDGTTVLGSSPIDSDGVASIMQTSIAGGSHSITATFTPDDSISSSWSSSTGKLIELATAIPTTTTVATSKASAGVNLSVTFTATVAVASEAAVPSGSPGLSGTVAFMDGTTVLGSSTINPLGVAALAVNTLAVGTHTITATFTPSVVNYSSSSGTVTQAVVLPSLAVSTSSYGVAVNIGSAVQVPFTLAAMGGYAGTVTGSCSSLPTNMSCQFSPSSTVFSGADTSTNVNVSIIALKPGTSRLRAESGIVMGTLVGFGLFLMSRRSRKLPTLTLVLLGLLCAAGLTGCGLPNIEPQRGTYNVNVTFTDGTLSYTNPVTVSVLGEN